MARPTNLHDIPDLTPDEASQQSAQRIAVLETDIVFWRKLADADSDDMALPTDHCVKPTAGIR